MVINANVCVGVIYMTPANTFWNTLLQRVFLLIKRPFRPYLNLIDFQVSHRASRMYSSRERNTALDGVVLNDASLDNRLRRVAEIDCLKKLMGVVNIEGNGIPIGAFGS